MTEEVALPPKPWDWVASGSPTGNGRFHAYLTDATGRKIAAIWGRGKEKEAIADHILSLANASSPSNAEKIEGLVTALQGMMYAFEAKVESEFKAKEMARAQLKLYEDVDALE